MKYFKRILLYLCIIKEIQLDTKLCRQAINNYCRYNELYREMCRSGKCT